MPIKSANKSKYPGGSPTSKAWKAIRAAILARAGHCCEQCRVPNWAVITRGTGTHVGTFMLPDGHVFDGDTGAPLGRAKGSEYGGKMVRIVLTTAHLDHDPENNAESNLKVLCQKCHLSYDHRHHMVNAAATRRSKLALADLFA